MEQKDTSLKVHTIECTPLSLQSMTSQVLVPTTVMNIHTPEINEYITSFLSKKFKACSDIKIDPVHLATSIPVVFKALAQSSWAATENVHVWADSPREAKVQAELQWELYLAHYAKKFIMNGYPTDSIVLTKYKSRPLRYWTQVRTHVEKAIIKIYSAPEEPFFLLSSLSAPTHVSVHQSRKGAGAPPTAEELALPIMEAILCSVITVETYKQELAVQTALGSKGGYLTSLPLKINTDFLDNIKAAYVSHQLDRITRYLDIYQGGK